MWFFTTIFIVVKNQKNDAPKILDVRLKSMKFNRWNTRQFWCAMRRCNSQFNLNMKVVTMKGGWTEAYQHNQEQMKYWRSDVFRKKTILQCNKETSVDRFSVRHLIVYHMLLVMKMSLAWLNLCWHCKTFMVTTVVTIKVLPLWLWLVGLTS